VERFMSAVRTRFAPSPTGFLHIGGARTALFSWLHARRHGGQFVLRIEDTDLERSTAESVNAILEGMTWLGLDYDEGPFFQTHRFERYREVIDQLLARGLAYRCYCTREELEQMRTEQMAIGAKPRYDGRHRDYDGPPRAGVEPVIRFKNPVGGDVVFDDLVRGSIAISNNELDDLIIARSDGTPTYNFTVVVDDLDMGITHVIRGDDHINNTPRQINIFRALEAEPPRFGHVPMILGADGKRLSKRHGAMGVMEYRERGFLPEALLNYLVRLGWSHGDREVFSLEELVELFDIEDVNRGASTFNPDKLTWLNHQYIMSGEPAHVARHLSPHFARAEIDPTDGPELVQLVEAQRERSRTLVELVDRSLYFYRDFEDYDDKAARKHLSGESRVALVAIRERLQLLDDWQSAALHDAVQGVAAQLESGFGKVAQPLRVAIAGGPVSPAIDVTLALVGRDRALARIDKALAYIDRRGED
jgi:glutamyl-tRNA synthetase